ncbi:MAG: hypothetical protein CMM01_17970 [Rhodopirellula sp.]|nr:hypothetical protein [Rhodopirellula sp.]
MTKIAPTARTQRCPPINDASEIARLVHFLPSVFFYLKDTKGRFTGMNASMIRFRGAKNELE